MSRAVSPALQVVPKAADRAAECAQCVIGRASLPARCPYHPTQRSAGDVLVRQGEVPAAVVLVKHGSVLVTSVGPAGDETYCAIRGPGSLLGLELLQGKAADYQAWALGATTVCSLSAAAFGQWLGNLDTPMGTVLAISLTEAEQRRGERVALAGRCVTRLARFLLERRRVEGHDAPLAVQHQMLARMLGMRPETLSRAIADLREQGAIGQGHALVVADAALLATAAGDAP